MGIISGMGPCFVVMKAVMRWQEKKQKRTMKRRKRDQNSGIVSQLTYSVPADASSTACILVPVHFFFTGIPFSGPHGLFYIVLCLQSG